MDVNWLCCPTPTALFTKEQLRQPLFSCAVLCASETIFAGL